MANIFKLAKSYRRKHPRTDFQDAIKIVAKKNRKKSKKVKNRQTGTSSRPADQRRHARRPGKRRSKGGSIYYERRKNRSDVPGSLTGLSTVKVKSVLKEKYTESLGKVLLQREMKKGQSGQKRNVKKLGKRIAEIKRSIKQLN